MLSRILIVDHDADSRAALAGWLTAAGCECVTAAASDEALLLAGCRPPDAAIVDVDLDGADRMSLARHLRERTGDMGVILLTSRPSFTDGVAAMRLGVNDYLLKPCGKADILEAVDRALAWRGEVQRDRSGRELLQEAMDLARDRVAARAASGDRSPAAEALLAALRSRLPETYEHSRRVARIAGRLATTLCLSDRCRADVEQAALLHDVGKLGLPDALLEHAGPLSDDEAYHLRSHVSIGFDMVSCLPSLQRLAHVLLATEERYDGTGHPSSLAGAEIPVEARIIAVADACDRLWVGRPRGDERWADEVNAALVREAGAQFDPDVVQAWLRLAEAAPCS